MKDTVVPIDRAGRVVLPKAIRQELGISPGDTFAVSVHGTAVTLTPNRETAGFIKKGKALVFSTLGDDLLRHETVNEALDAGRGEAGERIGIGSTSHKRRR